MRPEIKALTYSILFHYISIAQAHTNTISQENKNKSNRKKKRNEKYGIFTPQSSFRTSTNNFVTISLEIFLKNNKINQQNIVFIIIIIIILLIRTYSFHSMKFSHYSYMIWKDDGPMNFKLFII